MFQLILKKRFVAHCGRDSTNGFVTLTVTCRSDIQQPPNTYSAFDTRIDLINVGITLTVPDYAFLLQDFLIKI